MEQWEPAFFFAFCHRITGASLCQWVELDRLRYSKALPTLVQVLWKGDPRGDTVLEMPRLATHYSAIIKVQLKHSRWSSLCPRGIYESVSHIHTHTHTLVLGHLMRLKMGSAVPSINCSVNSQRLSSGPNVIAASLSPLIPSPRRPSEITIRGDCG